MEIIHQLGINQTVFLQLCIFLVTYLFVENLLFKPYFAALEEREKKTVGGEELAAELQKETQELHTRFETKARHINGEINEIYAAVRGEAAKEYERIIADARTQAQKVVDEARAKIEASMKAARTHLGEEAKQISSSIIHKLLAKS